MLSLILGVSARRFLKKCDSQLYHRLLERIKSLSGMPFPSDAKRIEGKKDKVFRVRMGDYRILYAVFYEKNELLIIDIDKRGRVYS